MLIYECLRIEKWCILYKNAIQHKENNIFSAKFEIKILTLHLLYYIRKNYEQGFKQN